jgi:hypothetical protein
MEDRRAVKGGQTAPQAEAVIALTREAKHKLGNLRLEVRDLEGMIADIETRTKPGAIRDVESLWEAVEALRDALRHDEPKRGD